IAAGILLAVFLKGDAPTISLGSRAAMIAGSLAALAVRGYFIPIAADDRLGWRGTFLGYPSVALACTVIVLAFIGLPVRSQVLTYLGKISYGLYVYHMMCISITDRILVNGHGLLHALLREIVALGLTIPISSLSYAILEKPFLTLKRRF